MLKRYADKQKDLLRIAARINSGAGWMTVPTIQTLNFPKFMLQLQDYRVNNENCVYTDQQVHPLPS